MKMFQHVRLGSAALLASAASLALAVACATAGTPASSGAPPSVPDLVGDAACSSDGQCRTIGVGAKACGGPQAYLAWSTQRTDENALRAAVERDAAAQRKEAEARGMVSNCAVTIDPGATCAGGVCR